MRNNLIAVLLSVLCALVAVDLRTSPRPVGAAFAETASPPSGQAILATVRGTSGEAFVILYDVRSQRLASYRPVEKGLQLRGVRHVAYDLRVEELYPEMDQSVPVKVLKERAASEER